jgi:hypothetical protein
VAANDRGSREAHSLNRPATCPSHRNESEVIRKRIDGNPAELPELQSRLHEFASNNPDFRLRPLNLTYSLDQTLTVARDVQLEKVRELENKGARISNLKTQYKQAIEAGWEQIERRKRQYGDPSDLSSLINEIVDEIAGQSALLGIPEPAPNVTDLENWLSTARDAQLDCISNLREKVGQLANLQDRYQNIVSEVVEDVLIPSDLLDQQVALQSELNVLNQELTYLTSTQSPLTTENQVAELHTQVDDLPAWRTK